MVQMGGVLTDVMLGLYPVWQSVVRRVGVHPEGHFSGVLDWGPFPRQCCQQDDLCGQRRLLCFPSLPLTTLPVIWVSVIQEFDSSTYVAL